MNGFSSPILFRILDDYELELVKLLVKYGADVNAKDTVGANSAHNDLRYEMLKKLGYFVTESSEHFAEYTILY